MDADPHVGVLASALQSRQSRSEHPQVRLNVPDRSYSRAYHQETFLCKNSWRPSLPS